MTGNRRNEDIVTDAETIIRPATPEDLKKVAEIYAHYVTHTVITFDQTPPQLADWRQRLTDLTARGLPFLIAERSGDVAGYAYAGQWRPKPAYRYTVENSIYLAPGLTGKGLGSALLGPLIDGCATAGFRRMIAVIADTGNPASVALHERFGFAHAGRLIEVGHKHGRSIDTILMQRPLATG
ncbi:N-acetyltransferase family protein [Nonomuraea fuscirosea]|uniref:GNAT family N-acetyltransferase n=1 Tax=Nonomuraea fuscirosea TaxID=1291556 RepID=UPI003440EEC9